MTAAQPTRKARVAVTAASSFSGLWITRELVARGWETFPLCSEREGAYSGLRGARVALLQETTRVRFGVKAERGGMAAWVREHRPEVWIHHHHHLTDFRSPDYDYARAMAVGVEPLPELVRALAESGCRGIVHSGTYFEPGEGGTAPGAQATPYARSKVAVWEALQTECARHRLPFSKVVTPNPVGALENDDRLIPLLIRAGVKGEKFTLRSPLTVSDQLPGTALASVYAELASELVEGKPGRIARPSGRVQSAWELARETIDQLLVQRLGLSPIALEPAQPAALPAGQPAPGFRNPEAERQAYDVPAFWNHYAYWLKQASGMPPGDQPWRWDQS